MDFERRSLQERLAGKILCIATPRYGGQSYINYDTAFVDTQTLLMENQIPFMVIPSGGDSLVQRARNVLVARFLETTATHLLFIDADIGWKPKDIIKLLAADKDIAGGIYPMKTYPESWPMNWHRDEELTFDDDTKWIAAKDLPTGFLMVSRRCIEDMISKHPEWKCRFDPSSGKEEPFSYALFDCFIDDHGIYLSEDFGFSRRAQADGYTCWADTTIALTHMGPHLFDFGCIADKLFPPAEMKIEGWMTPAELRWLKSAAASMGSIVEIGCWKGRSTHALASSCKGPVYAVDTWGGSPGELDGAHAEALHGRVYEQFVENLSDCNNVIIMREDSVTASQHFGYSPKRVSCFTDDGMYHEEDFDGSIDMVFIDASHEYEDVKADIEAWRPKARRLICGHDYNWPGVKRAVDEAFGGRATIAEGSIWQVWL